jgi:uncharacterized protein (TIGR01777 family)
MEYQKTILIAGGTGLIGRQLVQRFQEKGHQVRVLSRTGRLEQQQFAWDPYQKSIDKAALEGVDVIINLVGEGIADKRWTAKRKQALIDSRVMPTQFLAELASDIPTLQQYVTASGINCYGYEHYDRLHTESDAYGNDFLSQVVKAWEEAADAFPAAVKVTKLRTSVVLDPNGGALATIAKTVNNYVGAPLGSGKQWLPWISMEDMVNMYVFVTEHEIEGVYNALAGSVTNKEFTKTLAQSINKPLWLPNVPAFVMRIMLGEMASMVLDGLQADHSAILEKGFVFQYPTLTSALKAIYA